MPLIEYVTKRFSAEHRQVIDQANQIINEYARQGYDLTLRQLYYQFVARDFIPNNDRSYKRLGNIISDARRAGLIDWERIVDRTRYVREPASWSGPNAIVSACAQQFSIDFWANQPFYPEVWVEKDALVGVLEVACQPWNCAYFSCRGYTSDSEAWAAARRLDAQKRKGKTPIIFHLGDHDPSGIDMSRDIKSRLMLFSRVGGLEVRRIALTMEQIEEVNPPPNPAKQTDSRFADYEERYGDESWELDALSPTYIGDLIAAQMESIIDQDAWEQSVARRDEGRRLLTEVSNRWNQLTEGL